MFFQFSQIVHIIFEFRHFMKFAKMFEVYVQLSIIIYLVFVQEKLERMNYVSTIY